jgi:hypothetical protein
MRIKHIKDRQGQGMVDDDLRVVEAVFDAGARI